METETEFIIITGLARQALFAFLFGLCYNGQSIILEAKHGLFKGIVTGI